MCARMWPAGLDLRIQGVMWGVSRIYWIVASCLSCLFVKFSIHIFGGGTQIQHFKEGKSFLQTLLTTLLKNLSPSFHISLVFFPPNRASLCSSHSLPPLWLFPRRLRLHLHHNDLYSLRPWSCLWPVSLCMLNTDARCDAATHTCTMLTTQQPFCRVTAATLTSKPSGRRADHYYPAPSQTLTNTLRLQFTPCFPFLICALQVCGHNSWCITEGVCVCVQTK